MIILLDMDGVMADFERGLLNTFKHKHPDKACIEIEDRNQFYAQKQYPKESQPLVHDIMFSEGFFRNLPPIEGALEAIRQLFDSRHDIFICTSPLTQYQNCVLEKFEWVETHLGFEYTKRIVLTKDKTLVHGDVLVDDRPYINGTKVPSWEHVLYSQPYNRKVEGKKRLTWTDWQEILNV